MWRTKLRVVPAFKVQGRTRPEPHKLPSTMSCTQRGLDWVVFSYSRAEDIAQDVARNVTVLPQVLAGMRNRDRAVQLVEPRPGYALLPVPLVMNNCASRTPPRATSARASHRGKRERWASTNRHLPHQPALNLLRSLFGCSHPPTSLRSSTEHCGVFTLPGRACLEHNVCRGQMTGRLQLSPWPGTCRRTVVEHSLCDSCAYQILACASAASAVTCA